MTRRQRRPWPGRTCKSKGPSELRRLFLLFAGLAMILCVPSSRATAQEKQASPKSQLAIAKVIILPPQVVFEQSSANSHIQDDPNAAPFGSVLTSTATSKLSLRKYTLVAPESLQNSDVGERLKQLQPLTSRLARGAINDEVKQALSQFAALPEDYLILVQFLRVDAGPGKSWNPLSGAITSSMSNTLLQAALISTRTGLVVWKNEVLERKLFRADDPKFAQTVDRLYGTIGQ
jgi:hypothetical protein